MVRLALHRFVRRRARRGEHRTQAGYVAELTAMSVELTRLEPEADNAIAAMGERLLKLSRSFAAAEDAQEHGAAGAAPATAEDVALAHGDGEPLLRSHVARILSLKARLRSARASRRRQRPRSRKPTLACRRSSRRPARAGSSRRRRSHS